MYVCMYVCMYVRVYDAANAFSKYVMCKGEIATYPYILTLTHAYNHTILDYQFSPTILSFSNVPILQNLALLTNRFL